MRSALPAKVNGCLDKLAHPRLRVFGRSIAAFRLCGYVGLAVAVSLAMALVTYSGLSRWVMSGVVAAAVCTFLALVLLTKVLSGEESLTYYHHEVAVLSVAAAGLWLLGEPVLPYLDPTILGVGAFMACGRVGCLMAGCCYGRVQGWGIRYGREHVAEGFPSCYLGVGLFPVQALESLWVSFVVVAGSAMILNGGPPGEALAWYTVSYGLGRFGLEFLRGDPHRSYLWGFSEAQWTSLLLIASLVGAELSGLLALHAWHVAALAGLLLVMVALDRCFRRSERHKLLNARHVRELAQTLDEVARPAASRPAGREIYPGLTSLGIQVSAGNFPVGEDRMDHYALSRRDGAMTGSTARSLAELVVCLRHPGAACELVEGRRGVFHLLIRSGDGAHPASVRTEERFRRLQGRFGQAAAFDTDRVAAR